MTGQSQDGPVRLQRSGIGTIVGGLILGALSVPLSYAWASAVVIGVGLVGWLVARGSDTPTPVPLGAAAIGGIGAIEATTTFGIGMSPFVLALAAVAFGIVDIVVGGTLHHWRPGHD